MVTLFVNQVCYCMVGLGGCNGVVIIFMIFIFVTVRWPRSV